MEATYPIVPFLEQKKCKLGKLGTWLPLSYNGTNPYCTFLEPPQSQQEFDLDAVVVFLVMLKRTTSVRL